MSVTAGIVREGVANVAAAGWARRGSEGQWDVVAGGATGALFDLASLTKPMTALAIARTSLQEVPLADVLAAARGTRSENVPLSLLLAHRAGLEANLPLFRPLLEGREVNLREALMEAADARRNDAEGPVVQEGFRPLYSDLGYILAGQALADATRARDAGEAIEALVVDALQLRGALGTARTLEAFHGPPHFLEHVVPTEVVPWRGGEIRGRVHDENAYALTGDGGSGHAGMFGTVGAVLKFGIAACETIVRRAGPLATAEDLDWIVRPRPGGTLRAGFDGKTVGGGSMAGDLCGSRTFGHLGFTGTSFWIDPDAEIIVVLLTNRVHPTRENVAIRAARPRAHDALFALATGRSP